MTLEAWVFPTAGGGWRDVIYKGPDDIYYLMSSSDAGMPAAGGTFAGALDATSTLPLSVWSHLAATFDGATLRLYVNGVQVASEPVQAQIATSTGALTIGGDALYGQHFAGRIDEVRIYSRALSANELQTDINTPIGASGPPDTTPPTDPTGFTATAASQSQVNLAWTASTDNVAVTGYRVERCQGAACTNFVQIGTPTGTTFNDIGLSAATTYRYRVRAADAAGNLSGYSAIENATTPDTQAPTDPTGLSATAVSASQINLSWTASTDNVGRLRIPRRALPGRDLHDLRTSRDPDRHHLQRHRTHDGDDLPLPRARRRCGRQSQRLLRDPERGDDGHAAAHRPNGPFGDGCLAEPGQPRVDGLDGQRRGRQLSGRALPGRGLYELRPGRQPRPARPSTTSASARRRPTATASVRPMRPAISAATRPSKTRRRPTLKRRRHRLA